MHRTTIPALMLLAALPAFAENAPAPMPPVQKVPGVRVYVKELTGRPPKEDKCADPAAPMTKEGGIEYNSVQTYAGGWLRDEKMSDKGTVVEYSKSGEGITTRYLPDLKVCNELDRMKAINVLLGLAALSQAGKLETNTVTPSKDETRTIAGRNAKAFGQVATAGVRRYWAVADPLLDPLVAHRKAEFELMKSKITNADVVKAITQELRQPVEHPDLPAVLMVEFKAEGCDRYRATTEAVKIEKVDVLESDMRLPECRKLSVNDFNRVVAGGAEALKKIDEEAANPKPEAQLPGTKAEPEKAKE